MIPDNGQWKAGHDDPCGKVFIESDDFKHDVRLYVDGDFATLEDRKEYAEHIARRLDVTRPSVCETGGDDE